MVIENATLYNLIKDVANLCNESTREDFIEKFKNVERLIKELKNATIYEIWHKDYEISKQKVLYDKINFPKVKSIGKLGRAISMTLCICICLMCLIFYGNGIKECVCTLIVSLNLFISGGTYIGLLAWEASRMSIQSRYSRLKDSKRDIESTLETLENIDVLLEHITEHKYGDNGQTDNTTLE